MAAAVIAERPAAATAARRSVIQENVNKSPDCGCVANEWTRTVALRVLQTATESLSWLLQANRFSVSDKLFTDVKIVTQSVGLTFAGFDLISVARGVQESIQNRDWSALGFNHLPNGVLALHSIRTVAWRTDLSFPLPSMLSRGTEFLQKHISQDYILFVAGLSVSCFYTKASVSRIRSLTDTSKLSENRPHVLRVIANVTLTAYYALGLRSNASSVLKVGLLAASTACTFFAGPVKSAAPTKIEDEDEDVGGALAAAPKDALKEETNEINDSANAPNESARKKGPNNGNGGTCTIS